MNTSLFDVRHELEATITSAFPGETAILWAAPKDAEDVDVGLLLGWDDKVDVSVEPFTVPLGVVESYEQTLFLQALPTSDEVSAEDAAASADEYLGVIISALSDLSNRRPPIDEWDVMVTVNGYAFRTGIWGQTTGYAAGFDIRIGVEAKRCS